MFANKPPSSKQTKKKNNKSENDDDDDDPMWKKALRVLITGSPDGVSLLGKPQIQWSTMKTEYTAATGSRKWDNNGGRSKNKNNISNSKKAASS